jgi:hypothetical protein
MTERCRARPGREAARLVNQAAGPAEAASYRDHFDRPIFVLSTPRSGSTLLFETMAQAPDLYTVGGESHWLIEDIPAFDPATRGFASNQLTAEDAQSEPVEQLARAFYADLRDRNGRPAEGRVRMLEKTPKNALRASFFNAVWPDAEFVYLHRDVKETLASMMEAWASGAFQTYPQLPGWSGYPWSLLLIPSWEKLKGQPLPVIAAHQWATTTRLLLDELERIGRERVRAVNYADFLSSPQETARSLAASLGLDWDLELGAELPLSKTTVSKPRADKWRRLEPLIEQILPIVAEADAQARSFLKQFGV